MSIDRPRCVIIRIVVRQICFISPLSESPTLASISNMNRSSRGLGSYKSIIASSYRMTTRYELSFGIALYLGFAAELRSGG